MVESLTSTVTATMAILSTARRKGKGSLFGRMARNTREDRRMTNPTAVVCGKTPMAQRTLRSSATIYFMVMVESRTSTVTAMMAILSTARKKGTGSLFGRMARNTREDGRMTNDTEMAV